MNLNMHETSLMYDVINIAIKNGNNNNINSISKVYMKIGEFTCVDEHALRFAFEVLSKDTICQGAKLIIDEVKAKARCDYCNKDFSITFTDKLCPHCNIYSNNIQSGYELLVWQIEGD